MPSCSLRKAGHMVRLLRHTEPPNRRALVLNATKQQGASEQAFNGAGRCGGEAGPLGHSV